MRTVLRYVDGKAIWSDNEPARAHMPGHGGQLVVGDSGKSANATVRSFMARQRNEIKRIAREIEG
jgi:hypothetical protein